MLDLNKPVQLRDGTPARIICTDAKGVDRPLIVLIRRCTGDIEDSSRRYADGKFFNSGPDHELDLINIPVKKWRWAIEQFGVHGVVTTCHYTKQQMESMFDSGSYQIVGRILETEITE